MTNIDQFESAFKAAAKTPFEVEPVEIRSVLVVSDGDRSECESLSGRLKSFLHVLESPAPPEWHLACGSDFKNISDLLSLVGERQPQMICTYRNLHHFAAEYPYSLGEYLDVLTQATTIPVMVLPRPDGGAGDEQLMRNTNSVMAITDHLTGDHHLVSWAARLTEPGGTLHLTHVEDAVTFERYIDVIGKISEIDTDAARQSILEQLLKEPHDYIKSCREAIQAAGRPIQVEETVTLGHYLTGYRRMVQQHQVDILVLNTKDHDQLAMHGLAYPLSIELRRTPILML